MQYRLIGTWTVLCFSIVVSWPQLCPAWLARHFRCTYRILHGKHTYPPPKYYLALPTVSHLRKSDYIQNYGLIQLHVTTFTYTVAVVYEFTDFNFILFSIALFFYNDRREPDWIEEIIIFADHRGRRVSGTDGVIVFGLQWEITTQFFGKVAVTINITAGADAFNNDR